MRGVGAAASPLLLMPLALQLPLASAVRAFMEFCCGSNSILGAKAPDDTFVVRLTEKEDLTTSMTKRKENDDRVPVPASPAG